MSLERLPRLEGIGRLKRLPGLPGRKRKKLPALDPLPSIEETLSAEEKERRRLAKEFGSDRLAGRIVSLQKRFPAGSDIELATYDWLRMMGVPFAYQVEVFGGRRQAGGLVPDFVIRKGGTGLVWMVQGQYWHTREDALTRNAEARLRLLGQDLTGVRITDVVELWENQIKTNRPHVWNQALAGIGIGR